MYNILRRTLCKHTSLSSFETSLAAGKIDGHEFVILMSD